MGGHQNLVDYFIRLGAYLCSKRRTSKYDKLFNTIRSQRF